MEAFFSSTLLVAIGEIGDKTQLLALMLGARFRRPGTIVLGILAATLMNHTIAALGGSWIAQAISASTLQWVLGISFIAMAAWALKPDHLDVPSDFLTKHGIFAAVFVTFFLAEIGDKTQLATVALAARYTDVSTVVAGTVTGMLLADIPV